MATEESVHRAPRRALVEVSPDLANRFRDPRMTLAIVAAIGGAIALFAGYLGVSGTLDPAKQLPYLISGGVGGLFLLGVAAALLLSADLGATRDDIAELHRTVDRLATRIEELSDELAATRAKPSSRART